MRNDVRAFITCQDIILPRLKDRASLKAGREMRLGYLAFVWGSGFFSSLFESMEVAGVESFCLKGPLPPEKYRVADYVPVDI